MAENQSQGGVPNFVGVHMKCCNAYTRANLNHAKDAFVGWCPKCAKMVTIRIAQEGEKGSSSRFFEAS